MSRVRHPFRLLLLAGTVLAWSSPVVLAQFESPPPPANGQPEQDPLAAKEQIARDRMVQLEDRMYRLIEKLAAGEPEQAKRLEEALRQSKELLIRRHMDEVIELLNKGDLSAASDKESAVGKGIQQLLAILLAESDRRKELQQEAERLRAFDKTIKELIEEQRRLKDQLDPASAPADGQPDAGKQRDLEKRTGSLARQMQGDKNSEGAAASEPADASASRPATSKPAGAAQSRPGGKQGENGDRENREKEDPSTPAEQAAPGTENVQQAEQHMGKAADQLQGKQNEQARGDQQKAIDQLEEARRQLQETLDQLRREQQEEILRGLEARFTAMLVKQEPINRQTTDLDKKGPPAWTHADELALGGLARDEDNLAADAGEALHILEQEGTTIVFPQVVEELRDDLKEVARRLGNRQTGGPTALLQTDIVDLLKELIEAVQQLRRQNEEGKAQPNPAQSDRPPPLLPGSAELKLLRSYQVRINRMTEQLSAAPANAHESQASRDAAVRKTAERQRQVAETARKINERVSGQ